LKLNLLALVLVLIVLAVGYRNLRLTGLAVLPTAAAAGAASALLFVSGSHSPITILLTGVVVAFGTEFAVLWLSRYQAERTQAAAVQMTSTAMGPAIAASALALVVGFAALAISPVPTVRDFGLWSALDMLLASIAVLVLLPPVARRLLPPNF
jgi:predicted RND superfamily exporter protein